MATLGEAVRKFAEAQGVEVKAHATIGESIKAVAKAKGLPTDGTLSDIITEIAENEEEGSEEADGLSKVVAFFNSLSQEAISAYMVSNKDVIMEAFGVEAGESAGNIGTAIYDTLQGGDVVTVNMNDGGVLKISGHFYEPSDDMPYWDMLFEYAVPADGTDKCFAEGSGKLVKGGTVKIHMLNGEITDTEQYDMVLNIYGYEVDIDGVTFVDGDDECVIGIAGLTRPNDFHNPCIIDPNGATWEINIRAFYLPDEDAEGTVTVDGEPVAWADIRKEI